MDRAENDLRFIKFRKDFSYAKKTPSFVSNNIGGVDEIARWVLDFNDVLYKDEPHAPPSYISIINKLTGGKGATNTPVLLKRMPCSIRGKRDSLLRAAELSGETVAAGGYRKEKGGGGFIQSFHRSF